MRRASTIAGIVIFVACASPPQPYRDFRNPQIQQPWIVIEHHPGFEVVPSFIARLGGHRVPQTSWNLRISADGVVERDEHRGCEWKTVSLRRLSGHELHTLNTLVSELPSERTSGYVVEDAARDVVVVYSASNAKKIEVWSPYSRHEHSGLESFFQLWDQIASWFPPPLAKRSACGAA